MVARLPLLLLLLLRFRLARRFGLSLALQGRGQGAQRRGRLPARVEEVREDGGCDGRGPDAASRRPREAEPDAAGRLLLRLGAALGSEGHCRGRERQEAGRGRKSDF